MRLSSSVCLVSGALAQVNALIHQQVAFDNADVCWWGLVPPDLVCPVLLQQNLTDIVNNLSGRYAWDGGNNCEGEFCLYANRGFAGGRGISLITTEANYLRVKAVGDLLQEYKVSFNKDISSLPFHVTQVEGKGDGIVADKRMKRTDPIMAHTPVLLVHRSFKEDIPQSRQQALLDAAVDALPAPTAELFMDQMAHIPEQHRVAAILTTNAFQVNLNLGRDVDDGSGHHYGAFPEVAKLNHDCRPNAAFYIDPTTLMHITTAVKEIMPGDEITLSYLDPFAPHEERQERAQTVWGFGCGCSQCSASDQDVADSETRLREIKWIESKLEDSTSTEVSTGLITYLLGLYENERLYCCLAGAYALAALNFNMLGYASQAVMYAGLAIEALKVERGEGVPDIKAMEELQRGPTKHFTWKARVKRGKPAASAASTAAPTVAWAEASVTP